MSALIFMNYASWVHFLHCQVLSTAIFHLWVGKQSFEDCTRQGFEATGVVQEGRALESSVPFTWLEQSQEPWVAGAD